MSAEALLKSAVSQRIVPVAVIEHADHAVPAAQALMDGGLNVIEVTFRTAAAAECIRRIKEELPEMIVAAGTVLTIDQLKECMDCGAAFAVAPGLNEAVASAALDADFPFAPGVMTPTDVERAHSMGFKTMKFFPAEQAGGASMVKALLAPYGHLGISFIPTGGIHSGNCGDYLAIPGVAAIGGSWMIKADLVSNKDWASIASITRDALANLPSSS